MSGGKLLTPKEQIEHMKERGISFHLFSEEDALIFQSKLPVRCSEVTAKIYTITTKMLSLYGCFWKSYHLAI